MSRQSFTAGLALFTLLAHSPLPHPAAAPDIDAVVPVPAPSEPKLAATRPNAWERGQDAMRREALSEAILAFEEALIVSPNDPDLHNNLGACFARLRQRQKATELFQKALDLAPGHAQASVNLAAYARQDGRYAEAVALLEPISHSSKHAGLWQDLGYLYYRLGQLAKATDALERASTLARDPELLYNLACLYSLSGRHTEAVELLHEAIGKEATLALAHDALGQAYEFLDLIPQAKNAYATARQLEPANARFLRHLVRVLLRERDLAATRPLLGELLRLDPAGAETQRYEALMLLYEGADERAAGALQRIVARAPDDAAAWNNLAVAYRRIGETDQADDALAKARALNKRSPTVQTNEGLAAAQAGQWEQARESWGAALKLQPEFEPALRNLEVWDVVAPAARKTPDER